LKVEKKNFPLAYSSLQVALILFEHLVRVYTPEDPVHPGRHKARATDADVQRHLARGSSGMLTRRYPQQKTAGAIKIARFLSVDAVLTGINIINAFFLKQLLY